MIDLTKLFDSYSRQARLYPALLTLLPGITAFIAWFPKVLSQALAFVVTLVVTCGALYILAILSRTLGKKHEQRLLSKWGSWPTTTWLRHSSSHLSSPTRARYHKFLSTHVPDIKLPSEAEESADPQSANEAYGSVVKWLQEQCRGGEFGLLLAENTEYGFRRNMRGLKDIGLVIAVLALAVSWAVVVARTTPSEAQSIVTWAYDAISGTRPLLLVAVAVNMIAILLWLAVVRDSWVREAGDQYAKTLLACCDKLARPKN